MATNQDVELGTSLVMGAILNHQGGIDKLAAAIQQAGPQAPMLLAQALAQDFMHAKDAIVKNRIPIDPRAWPSPGGVFDQVIKQVCELLSAQLGQSILDGKFMAAVKHALMQALKGAGGASAGAAGPEASVPTPEAMGAPQGQPMAPMPNMEGMQ